MRQTTNLGLALYDTTDKMSITGAENSLNHNMELIDAEMAKTMKTPETGETGQVLTKTEAGFEWRDAPTGGGTTEFSDKTLLPDAECNVNVLTNYEWTDKGYYYGNDGLGHDTSGYYALPLIPVIPGQTYRITVTTKLNGIGRLCKYYDANKKYVQDATEAGNAINTYGNTDFIVPDNAYYIGLSYASGDDFANYTKYFTSFMRITSLEGDGEYTLSNLRITKDNVKNIHPYKDIMQKVIVNLGDSIFGNNDSETSISNLLADNLNCAVYNCAFGGTRAIKRDDSSGYEAFDFSCLVDSIVAKDYTVQETALADHGSSMSSSFTDRLERLKGIDFEKVDIVTLNFGANDYTGYYVKNDYISGYTAAIGKLMSAYPQIKVILITPAYRVWYASDGSFEEDGDTHIGSNNTTLLQVVDDAKTVAENLHIKVIDVQNCGINKFNYSRFFPSNDGAHHNENGRRYLAEFIAKGIMTN